MRLMKEETIIKALSITMIIGILWIMFNLGFIAGNEIHQKNLDYVINKYTELETKYNEKIQYCDKNHYELLRYGVGDNND